MILVAWFSAIFAIGVWAGLFLSRRERRRVIQENLTLRANIKWALSHDPVLDLEEARRKGEV